MWSLEFVLILSALKLWTLVRGFMFLRASAQTVFRFLFAMTDILRRRRDKPDAIRNARLTGHGD